MLDNDFHDPDIDRYLDAFDRYDPSVAVLGDAYTPDDAQRYQDVVDELEDSHPYKTYIVVPKSQPALHELDDNVTLGYPNGYSDVQAEDYTDPADWRGEDIHILGGSPPKTWDVIQELTQPTLTSDDPANIVGLDWNGPHKISYMGERWSRKGWKPADHMTIRETVQKSLDEIKKYWQERGVWPDTEPIELYGPPVQYPDRDILMDRGGDPITTRDKMESAYIGEYDDRTVAFESESQKAFIEWREGWY